MTTNTIYLQERLKKILNKEQYSAVVDTDGPLLILAGAGSGKTRVITHKIQYLIDKGIAPSSILAVTFTNKAAREMKQRVQQLVGSQKKGALITTFHSLGLHILTREIQHLGYRDKFSIYDDSDCMKMLRDIIHDLRLPEDMYDPYELNFKIGVMKMNLRNIPHEEDPDLHTIYETYQKNLKIYNAVDFNDLIKLPITLFEQYPEVLSRYDKKWKYVLVDEYQDTSHMQYKLMKYLSISHKNISVVGDDDQSIYSWRGANSTNISLFEKDFYKIKEIKLEQNYRSTGTILKAANAIINNNQTRRSKNLWTSGEDGNKIYFYAAKDEEEEADFVLQNIFKFKAQGYENDDFGILFRMNSQSRAFEEKLRDSNIPYKVIGATKFFERPEIKDILSYMRFLANLEDEVSLSRIINNPKRGIGNTTILALLEHAKNNSASLYSTIRDFVRLEILGPKASSYLEDFYNLIEKYREMIFKPKNIAHTVMQLVDEIDYQGKLLSENKNIKAAQFKMRNINQLYQSISNYEKNPDNLNPSIYEYLQRVSLSNKDDDENTKEVNLLSIHSAKGLEYKIVFIVGAEEGLIPHDKTLEETGTDEEERRLFYVAVTRARETLYISYPETRMKYNELLTKNKSPFMEEIPEELIHNLNESEDNASPKENEFELLLQKWNK